MIGTVTNVELCTDNDLGYLESKTTFRKGSRFLLDETYRLRHLPLVSPDHPDVIASKTGTTYNAGRRERVVSAVLSIPEVINESAAYIDLVSEMRAAPFADKIAWGVVNERRGKLHVTIGSSLLRGDGLPAISARTRGEIAALGAPLIEVRGLYSGRINHGRLYLKIYPEKTPQGNRIHQLQRLLGCRETDLFLVGLFNFRDHLDPDEAAALASLIERWWDTVFVRFRASQLWLLATHDDLVLDAQVADVISLSHAT